MSTKLPPLLLLASLALPAADKIVGGPFVVNDIQRAATIVWVVESDQVTLRAQGGGEARTAPSLHAESVTMTSLKPGTVYEYNVPGKESLKGTFKTPPATAQPFEFVLYGDNRTRHDVHRKVVEAILKTSQPDFILQTGDMVENGTDSGLWPVFFDIERELLRKTAFFPIVGNHERNSRDFHEFFQVPQYYSFTWGNAHFALINSDIANMGAGETVRHALWKEEATWLEEDLKKNQSAQFRFVVAHHSPITAVANRQGANPHMIALIPMLEQMHVTAALFGHDHNYQHYLKNGIHYVTSGGGGAPLYDVNKPPAGITQKVVSTENFLRFRSDGKTMHADAMDATGAVIDTFDLTGGAH